MEQGCGALVSKTLAFNVHRDGRGESDAALLPGQKRLQLLREAPRQNRSARLHAIVGRSTRGFPSLGNQVYFFRPPRGRGHTCDATHTSASET